jgi:hypothetical protein
VVSFLHILPPKPCINLNSAPCVPYALPVLSILLDLFTTQKFLCVLRLLIVYLLQFNIKLSFVITFILRWACAFRALMTLVTCYHCIDTKSGTDSAVLTADMIFLFRKNDVPLMFFSTDPIEKSIILCLFIAALVPSDLLFSTKLNPYFASFHAALLQ